MDQKNTDDGDDLLLRPQKLSHSRTTIEDPDSSPLRECLSDSSDFWLCFRAGHILGRWFVLRAKLIMCLRPSDQLLDGSKRDMASGQITQHAMSGILEFLLLDETPNASCPCGNGGIMVSGIQLRV